jgi:competence protein ComEA
MTDLHQAPGGSAEPRMRRATAALVVSALLAAGWSAMDQPRAPEAPLVGPLSLRTATVEQLELLPGVGRALAERIVQDRVDNGPCPTVQHLDRVRGVGPAMLQRLAPHVVP